ncbi:MAG: acyl-[acyl-carrier-protein]--UDP-N-acetylglucosamine O-acyltransferase [Desulfuromonas sp.]|uniref:acyl-ACP--UDP-N-acetylglucosamine O-acyltransferase n=1 Tax=Desulfuromonas sp. TaxID=892 RepID=UPI000CAD76C7|nr:acyl-ACP--UDP-N-acetylglucosamine O-acyltransferase [Desulfuromonas sp.]PLX85976.1 MAG: acyl-[acyl-carrier-protein]--UDP-N-acetylglucosamine O-acyltransferase [Desulfuromonas sp.]
MIHPTAIIHEGARIADGVEIGPYAVIGEHVSIASGTTIGPHAVIEGWTEIGRGNRIFQFASVGAAPQDLKFGDEKSWLRIGDRNTIREFTTLHRGTESGGGETVVGSDCLFMAYSHVAHDCRVADRVILANGATLAGHVEVGEQAIFGGLSAAHQFARIGCHAMISGGAMVTQDIAPFTIAQGDRAKTVGINTIGLERRGFSPEAIRGIKRAFKLVFRSKLRTEEALEKVSQEIKGIPEVDLFADFVRNSQRGVAR